MPDLALRQRGAGGPGILSDTELRSALRASAGQRLLCRACGAAVTSQTEQIAIEGSRVHCRTNPAGIEFEFGCFLVAPGAELVGEPTSEFSWFAGYTWVYSICRSCGAHLGWFFAGERPSFHGLILDRLEPEEPLH